MTDRNFQPCPNCAKLGPPVLCVACSHNKELIEKLKKESEIWRTAMTEIAEDLEKFATDIGGSMRHVIMISDQMEMKL